MKLHEFTDRFYAMGGIDQEEKKNRRLTEDLNDIISVTVDFNSDEDDYEVINYIKQKYNIDVVDYDPTDYIENATLRGTKSNIIKYLATEYQGYDSEEEGIDWVEEFYPELFDESLTEARNPENDEVNAAIRRYLASDKAYIPKKDRDLFDKYGITPDKFPRSLGSRKYIQGSNGDVIGQDLPLNVHPDYDLANAVTKQKLDKGDREVSTKDMMGWYDLFDDGPKVSDNDTSKMSSNQFKSLQPYAQEKELIRDTRRRKNRALQDEEERIKAAKEETERRFKYADEDKERAMKKVRAKRAARKNESLNLNESKQGLIDYFNELMSTFGVKPYDQIDYILGYMSESDLLNAIDDFKEYMDVDDSELDEAVDFAKDDLKQDFLALCKEHNLDKDTAIEALLSMLGKHAMKVLMLNLKKHFDK